MLGLSSLTPLLPPACYSPHHRTTCHLGLPHNTIHAGEEQEGVPGVLITSQLVRSYPSHFCAEAGRVTNGFTPLWTEKNTLLVNPQSQSLHLTTVTPFHVIYSSLDMQSNRTGSCFKVKMSWPLCLVGPSATALVVHMVCPPLLDHQESCY